MSIHLAAQAQFALSPRISPIFPVGPVNNYVDTGLGYGAELTYAISDRVRLGVTYDRYRFDLNTRNLNLGGIDLGGINLGGLLRGLDFKFNVTPITGTFQYLFSGERIHPYVGLEAGIYYLSVSGFGLNINRQYFGAAPVAGILYPVSDRLDFYANVKAQTVFVKESAPIIGDIVDGYLLLIPVNVGISFKLDR